MNKYLPEIIDTEQVTPESLDKFAEDVISAIRRATEETTPRKKTSPFTKRWWNDELSEPGKIAN